MYYIQYTCSKIFNYYELLIINTRIYYNSFKHESSKIFAMVKLSCEIFNYFGRTIEMLSLHPEIRFNISRVTLCPCPHWIHNTSINSNKCIYKHSICVAL